MAARHARAVSGAWQTAQVFRDIDPAAALAAQRISDKLRDPYGIDVDDLHAVRQALADHAAARTAFRAPKADVDEAAQMLRDAAHE